ncbi:MAG: cupin domain-containing protein, partial [Actinobacteria bacterium]|nr:cupin domain-containing protein [Actinomycetota bacterium]
PREEGQLIFGTSIIYPGKVGSEYFMTKGHYHEKPDTAEIYFCLKGKGYLIMESLEGETSIIFMQSGSIGYVPPRWAHRTANTGDEPLICFYSVPADAGHDYEEIAKSGFKVIAIEIKREAKVVSLKDIHKIY